MKITAFYPTVATRDTEKIIKDMEKVGFRIIHQRFDLFDEGDTEYVLENENGQRMDVVSCPEIDEDRYVVRINVDDFDEAMKIYTEQGFTVCKGPRILPDSKNIVLFAPGKLPILLMQHIKKD